jgi:Domain of unknown function (DUF4349)
MNRLARRIAPALSLSLLLGACASAPKPEAASSSPANLAAMPESATKNAAEQRADTADGKPAASPAPDATKPQLIRTASLHLTVPDVDAALGEMRTLLKQQQGDIYNLMDERGGSGDRRLVSLELKVPQQNLDATLTALMKLGTVVNTQVASEDVTTQIVDTEARLKNLRQEEAMTQKIMDRAGSIKDVLAVSQQLSQVREQIERLDAQVKQLKTKVAYSSIKLQLDAAIVGGPVSQNTFGQQVQDRWNGSTRSATQLMIGFMLLGIGLIPFLPLLLLLGGGLYVFRRRLRRGIRGLRRPSAVTPPTE